MYERRYRKETGVYKTFILCKQIEIMPKVSIIIPVYGVEKYIERCIRSLFEQTLDDIEYLFIDDCTPDRSIDILKQVLEEYPHRKCQVVIHRMEQNSGQAKVREWGMKNATGEFVIHCDSDDWVDIHMYEDMYNMAIEERVDIVVCDYEITDGANCTTVVNACHASTPEQLLDNFLLQKDPWSLCNKLFKKTAYYNIVYPKGAMGEDMVICFQSMFNCKTLAYINNGYYKYYLNSLSITKNVSKESCIQRSNQLIENATLLLKVIEAHNKDRRYDAGIVVFQNFVRSVLYPLIHYKDYYIIWRSLYGGINLKVLLSNHINMLEKIRVVLATIHLYPRKRDRAN